MLAGCPFENPKYEDPNVSDSEVASGSESESASESYGTNDPSYTTYDDTSYTDLCVPFGNRIIQFQGLLDQYECEFFTASFRVEKTGFNTSGELCLDNVCQECIGLNFDIDVPEGLVVDEECLTLEHRGIWKGDDPEAIDDCKTTFLGIFESEESIPRYVASSRVFELPNSFPDKYAIEVEKGDSWECVCGGVECCPDNFATQFEVEFRHNDSVITLVPGSGGDLEVGDYEFYVDVLRAHTRGVADEDTCTIRNYLDWQMYRLP